jgi:hypothetical protein
VTVKALRYAEISAARVIRVPLIQQIELGENGLQTQGRGWRRDERRRKNER